MTLTVRRLGRLVAVVPLLRRRTLLESMANDHTPGFDLVAEDAGARRALARALLGRRVTRVTLDYLDGKGDAIAALESAADEAGYRVTNGDWERPPFVAVGGSWEAYEQSLDGKLRRDLARRRRRLDELGQVTFDFQDGTSRLAALLDEGFSLEPSGWKDSRGTAIVSRPETRVFYTGLARWAADTRMLRMSFLRVEGRPIAFQLGLEDDRAYYFVKGGFDREYLRFAPAKLLVEAQLERVFARGRARFEFLGPPEPFKLEWTSTCHDLRRFQAFRRTPAGVAAWGAVAYGRPAARNARTAVRRLQQLRAKT